MKQTSSMVDEYNSISCTEIKHQYINEASTWESFKLGNESAFISIYTAYFDQLFVYGNQFSKDEDTVKDVIQDMFIELRINRQKLGRTDSIKFYLFKCLKRRIIKETNKWFHRFDNYTHDLSFNFTFSPEQVLIDRQLDDEKVAKLNQAIKALSPRKREVIYYFYYQNLNYQQIQEMMQLSNIKSARNLVYKAIDFLRDNLR